MLGLPTRPRVTNSFLHRLLIRRKGKIDGRRGIPRSEDQRSSNYEAQLLDRGRQILHAIVRDFAKEIQHVEGDRQAAIDRLEINTEKYVSEVRAYQARKNALGRDVTIHLRRSWYLAFLFLIVCGEFALNSQAFDVFQKAPWLTYVMALTVAIGIPFVAHFTGIWIKQWPQPSWKTATKIAITVIVTIACLVGLNTARREYLNALGIEVGEHGEILERAFLMINMFVFLAATLMSYFSHDEDQELENVHNRVEALDAKIDSLNGSIRAYGGRLDGLIQREHGEMETVRSIILELVHLYRDQNEGARSDDKRPACFEREPELPPVTRAEESQKRTAEVKVDAIHERRRVALLAETDAGLRPAKAAPNAVVETV